MRCANRTVGVLFTVFTLFLLSLLYSAISLYSIGSSNSPLTREGIRNVPLPQKIHPKDLNNEKTSTVPVASTTVTSINISETGNGSKFLQVSPQSYSFTAVADHRNGNMGFPCVRILMAIKYRTPFKCLFPDGTTVEGKLYEFSENHDKQFKTFYLNCKAPSEEVLQNIEWITIIELAADVKATVPIVYRIRDETQYTQFDNQLSICVPFLFGRKYSAERTVEFMELNKILGVDQVTIYTEITDLNEEVQNVIKYYQRIGKMEIVSLALPFETKNIWYHGQLLSITDCLLRHTGRSSLLAFHDLDEFLIPMSGSLSTLDTLHSLFSNNLTGSIRVPVKYFDPRNGVAPITLKNTKRVDMIEKRYTKCVVRPHFVFEQGIHHTSRVIQDNQTVVAGDPNDLVLFHYKKKGGLYIEDNTISTMYKDVLEKRYAEVMDKLKAVKREI